MNYAALIENRKSVRAFRNKVVSRDDLSEIQNFYAKSCQRLIPEIATELVVLGSDAQAALEGSAGYEDFLIGAPQYLVLLSAPHAHASMNAGYMMENLVLKLTDLGLDSCWITFNDAGKLKAALNLTSPLEVAAVVAFGYGEKTAKKMRFNILSMSNVDITASRGYYSPKKDITDLVSVGQLDCTKGLDEIIGFYDDMLWQSFYAASKAPSYLNRQPYGFVIKGHQLILVDLGDPYTDPVSAGLGLGIVMLHFDLVAGQWVGKVNWQLDAAADLELPAGCKVVAVYNM